MEVNYRSLVYLIKKYYPSNTIYADLSTSKTFVFVDKDGKLTDIGKQLYNEIEKYLKNNINVIFLHDLNETAFVGYANILHYYGYNIMNVNTYKSYVYTYDIVLQKLRDSDI